MPYGTAIHRYNSRLAVRLSREEIHDRGVKLAQLQGQLSAHIEDTKSKASMAAAQKKKLEAEISILAQVMRNGEEDRDVPVEVYADKGEAVEVRKDTEAVITRRPLAAHEKQKTLFGDNPGEEEKEDDGEDAE